MKLFKLAIILPLLLALLLPFNAKLIAQEPVATVRIEKVQVLIDKYSTDANIKSDTDFLREKGVTLKFKGIKRNASGEIIAIHASYKDDTGKSGTYNLSGDGPIEPFVFSLEYAGDTKKISFGSASSMDSFQKAGNNFTQKIVAKSNQEDHGKTVDKKQFIIKKLDKDGVDGEMEWFTDADSDAIKVIIGDMGRLEKIIVNGKEMDQEEFEEIEEHETDGEKIQIKKVRKGDDHFSFIIKDSGDEQDIIAVEEGEGDFFFIDNEGDGAPLYRIDGKEATEGEVKKRARDQIESIKVYKGAKAIEKFGDKAKDGMVEITVKKQE